MNNLTSSLTAKIAAIFLLALDGFAATGAAIAAVYMYEYNYYGGMIYTAPDGSYTLQFPSMYRMLALLAAAIVAFLILLIFLLCSAGHRKGAEGITLNGQDKIPLDLYLAVTGTVAGLLVYAGCDVFYEDLVRITLSVLLFTTAFLLGLAIVMTCAARLKAGAWWKNTVIFYLLGFLRRIFGEAADIVHMVPLVWRTGLIFCAATFLNFLLALWFFGNGGDFLPFLLGVIFNGVLFFSFCRVSLDLRKLREAGERLAAGDVEYKTDTRKMYWEFRRHGENLNRVGDGLAIAVDKQMKSERLKTELITNVSHDIKTPLTSIINYVDLLEKEGPEGRSAEYLEVLERQAKRLKKLTEDLVEASKASTGNLAVALTRTDVCELVRQAVGEYAERLEAGGLESIISAPEGEVFVLADGRLLWRVMDNLFSNTVKYAQPGTRVYIDVTQKGAELIISVKNISRDRLNVDAEELMERFVRGESSRSTEGSGLGLNIARSLAELMKGTFALHVDGDLFKAEIRFQRVS